MQRRIPVGAAFIARVFDQRIFHLQRVAYRGIRQVGNLQMDRGDPRQALIIRVQGGCHRRKARHEAIHRLHAVIGALQQPLDFAALADDKASVTSLDQRRVPEPQAMVGAGEP